jgi:predicted Fe-S protein YdhL (DUF1289 family)
MLREQWNNATPAERQEMVQRAREKREKRRAGTRLDAPHVPRPH